MPRQKNHAFPTPLSPFGPYLRQSLLIAFASTLLLIVSSHAFAEQVKVGVYGNKPLVYQDEEGAFQGLTIDILRYAAGKEGWDLVFVPGSWAECLQRLEKGEIDLQVAIAVSPARKKIFNYPEKTLITNWGRLYRHPDSAVEFLLDLDGKTVALLEKDIHARVFVDLMEKFNQKAKLIYLTSYEEVLEHIQAGKVDTGVVNRIFATQNAYRFKVEATPMIFNPIEVRYAAPKGKNAHLLQALDRHLQDLQEDKDSVYYHSLEKWLGHSATTRVPQWIKATLLIGGGLLVFVLIISMLLKKQVSAKTAELKKVNQQLTGRVSQLQEAEKELLRQHRIITLNHSIASVFLTAPSGNIYTDVLDVILEALDSRFGLFGYIDDAGNIVCPSLTRDAWDQCQVSDKNIVFHRDIWGGIWGRSLIEKRTMMANEGLLVPEGHVPLKCALATPIIFKDVLIGQFVVANKPEGYNEHDRKLLESVAAQTAPILNALLKEARQKQKHEKLEEEYRQSLKMESVGRLAGGVAHDFNNMLGVILGNTELALKRVDPSQPLHADLLEIGKAAERSADLTRQLLAFARKQTIAPRILNLNETVAGMLTMLQRLIGEDIILTWRPGIGLYSVKIDPSQIDQLLANLCVNARDAITGVGKVTIETQNTTFDEAYCADHAGVVPGEYALLAVSDNGCGMDPETRTKIFDPFFTTKGLGKGTGLGLSTVYGIVSQNNGFINVYSESGQGTTFMIYFPRHVGKVEGKQEENNRERQEDIQGGHEAILLVEDEPSLLEMTKRILEDIGYQVLSTGTPENAVELANNYTGTIDLLLTDVVMPEMNGLALSKQLLFLYPELKSIFMSGYTANVIAHHGILDEGVDFIPKPFSRQDLAAIVRKVLDRETVPGQE